MRNKSFLQPLLPAGWPIRTFTLTLWILTKALCRTDCQPPAPHFTDGKPKDWTVTNRSIYATGRRAALAAQQ